MAKGPSIDIPKKRAAVFLRHQSVQVDSDMPIAKKRLLHQRVAGLRSCGKHFPVEQPTFSLRVHLLMLGSCCIDERRDKPIRLGLGFARGQEIKLDTVHDRRTAVMAEQWDAALARKKLRALLHDPNEHPLVHRHVSDDVVAVAAAQSHAAVDQDAAFEEGVELVVDKL